MKIIMFSKKNNKMDTVIGPDSNFIGEIQTKGSLRIDGGVEGNISADWVIIGEKAVIKGDIMSRGVIVGGQIEGNLYVKEIVEILAMGKVIGDISTSRLSITEGGWLNGRTIMQKPESNIIELQAK